MNPVYTQTLTSLVVRALTVVGTILVTKGWLTNDQVSSVIGPFADQIVGGLIVIATALYGVIRTWIDRKKINTALASTKPMSEAQLQAQIKDGTSASVHTAKTDVPALVTTLPK